MLVYSTCRTCGGSLLLGEAPECKAQQSPYWHDGCDPKPTKMEKLLARYMQLAGAEGRTNVEHELGQIEAEIDELAGRPPRLMDAALLYVKWGWPVHPLKPRSKEPNTPHGFKDATTDVERIRRWWERHPDDNIGLATGHLFDVIDIDVPKHRKDGSVSPSGFPEYERLLREGKLPDCHGIASTAAGGLHLFMKTMSESSSSGGLLPGIDIRGKGGYVVAAPSVVDPIPEKNYSGGSYSWTYVPSPAIKA